MFYDKIIALCALKGISSHTLACDLGMSNSVVSQWKRGKKPRNVTIKKVADYFGVPVESLLGGANTTVLSGNNGGVSVGGSVSVGNIGGVSGGNIGGVSGGNIGGVSGDNSAQELELLQAFRQLSTPNRARALCYVYDLIDKQGEKHG